MKRNLQKHQDWQRRSVKASRQRARSKHDHKYRRIGRNRERSREARERDFGPKAAWIRSRSCDACGAPPPCDPHHYPTRAAGGTSRDLSSLCRACHESFHREGAETFQDTRNLDLAAINELNEEEWRERNGN